jgi:hypothetical protein
VNADAGSLAAAARLTVGVVLACSGVAKLVSREGNAGQLTRLGVPRALAPGASMGLPLIELTIAALVLAVPSRWPVWLAVGAFALFTGVVVAELQRGEHAPCRCFGSLSNRPMSTRALVRNAWLLALAVVATGASSGLSGVGWFAAPLVVVSAVLILTT